MPSKSKTKGSGYERELVKQFQDAGWGAKRAWGSNGEALGKDKEVDVVAMKSYLDDDLEVISIQAKRRKKLPAFLQIPSGVEAVVFREDNGRSFIMFRLEDYIR